MISYVYNVSSSYAHAYRCRSLVTSKTEEDLIQKKTSSFGEMNLQEFARILRLDEKDPTTQQLFRIHDKVCMKLEIKTMPKASCVKSKL
jgi:hypothetical protein